MTKHLSARELVSAVLDNGSFASWDEPILISGSVDEQYRADLERARAASGLDESVMTGRGTIDGHPVAVIVSEFAFLAGSVGVACANRIEAAVRRATRERLPLLAAPASGGTRMQEGTIAFVQMVRITAAIVDHREAALPYLVYLRHPTTGGVFASWGSLGHITVAEPGALVGFLGPKVFEALNGRPFPEGIQRSENLAAHGVIDAVVAPAELGGLASSVLRILEGAAQPVVGPAPLPAAAPHSAWESVLRTRQPRRPGIRQLLRHAASDVVPLSGTAEGEQQPGLVSCLATLAGTPCVIVGQDRDAQRWRGLLGPSALRQVRRSIRLAAELRLPLVTIIDTPGASLSPDAEEGGLAGEIARCLADLLVLPSPTVAVLLGEGGGGAALALLPADRIVAAEHAWLSPLPPEGASAILYRGDTSHAGELAEAQGVSASRLATQGIVDVVVPEDAGSVAAFARALAQTVAAQLAEAARESAQERMALRAERFHVAEP